MIRLLLDWVGVSIGLLELVPDAQSQQPTSQPASRASTTADYVPVPIDQLRDKFRLIGRLGVPLGEVVEVEGLMVEGRFKGYEGGPNVVPHRIAGVATQKRTQLKISVLEAGFGNIEKPIVGRTYKFRGYETGDFVGIPTAVLHCMPVPVQTCDHYFCPVFRVFQLEELKRADASPADFVDRDALIEGTATSQNASAVVRGNGWNLIVDPKAPWPIDVEGKRVAARGTIRKTESAEQFELEAGDVRLVRLEDQIYRTVRLRGTAQMSNNEWRLHYRGQDVYVVGMKDLPGWSHDLHLMPVEIAGTLVRDKADYYVVQQPSWKQIDSLLFPELFPIP